SLSSDLLANLSTQGAFINGYIAAVSNSRPVEAVKFPVFRSIRRIRAILNLPVGFSWNISEVCPSDCECYWWKVILEERAAGEEIVELPLDEVISRFKKYRRRGMLNATLVGGEPMVRRESIEALTESVRGIHYVVVTSATTPLRPFRDTTLVISVDGQ